MKKITLVTGFWDIGRNNLDGHWKRSNQSYIDKLNDLLKIGYNFIVFGDDDLKNKIPNNKNIQFINRDLSWFENEFFDKIQKIRTDENWYNQSGWLPESTQAKLKYYNPIVMSKMMLLNDARILDQFDSEYMFWIDAGISNTVHLGYFTHDNVLTNITKDLNNFLFVCFPYKADTEIHGFSYPDINRYCNNENIEYVARAGFFGGPITDIEEIFSNYYRILNRTLSDGYMGTEESIFSIMLYKHKDLIKKFIIKEDGLLNTFFEAAKSENVFKTRIGLYVITFNSPNQFEKLCKSIMKYDPAFIEKTEKYLLNNSTKNKFNKDYNRICKKYGFEEIKKDNIGICGGRQFIAEHFDKADLDYYYFFEDDMLFYNGKGNSCKNGFVRKINNIFNKTLNIIKSEELDFLKLNFTEFFGDNTKQWAWHNLPEDKRKKYFGNLLHKPFVSYNNIKSYKSLPYATGEIYYCNWPQVVSKKGNKEMFIKKPFEHPFEQTWMSDIYQKYKKKKIKSAILLASPTEHYRFEHYKKEERKEC